MLRVLVALTGASGVIYGVRLVQRLAASGFALDVVVSEPARKVLAIEHQLRADPLTWLEDQPEAEAALNTLDNGDITAPPASGSRAPAAMIIAPCTMGTAARIATGVSTTLIERAADVMLKERRPLVVVPRESPLSSLHLRNLLALSELGARVVPAMPAFYTRPQEIEELIAFVVDRAIQAADLDVPLRHVWQPQSTRRTPQG